MSLKTHYHIFTGRASPHRAVHGHPGGHLPVPPGAVSRLGAPHPHRGQPCGASPHHVRVRRLDTLHGLQGETQGNYLWLTKRVMFAWTSDRMVR